MRWGIVFALVIAVFTISESKSMDQGLVITGADNPAFIDAVATWLDDDDANGLTELSALARDGSEAARLILARIEITDRAPTEFVKGLSRTQRMALYRSNPAGSVFRTSWLKAESDAGNANAATLLASTALGVNIPAIERLISVGETEAAEHLIKKVAVDGTMDQRHELASRLDPDSELMPFLEAFRFMHDGKTTGITALRLMVKNLVDASYTASQLDADAKQATRFVDIGYQAGYQTPGYGPGNRYYDAIADWVLNAPVAQSVATLCRRSCTEKESADCANLALGLVGGYYEIIRFDSPLEAIIPQARFLSSNRAQEMTRRKIALFRTEAGEAVFSAKELRNRSNCLANAIASEQLRAP